MPLGSGFEEMEAVAIIDVLRRGGVEVVVAGVSGAGLVLGSRGVNVHAPISLAVALDVEHGGKFDAIVLPGGMGGTEAMCQHDQLRQSLRDHASQGRLTAAICAAPLVLERAGLVGGRALTCHPSVRAELRDAGAHVADGRVVRDGVLLTSQGPGTAIEFALAIVSDLVGAEVASEVGAAMCV